MTEDLKKTVEETRMNIIYRSEYLRQCELREDAIEEGREEGREEERANTERERKRAEAAEAEVERLKKLLS